MSAPKVSFPEGMSLRLKREEPIQGGEDGVFLPLALQIGSSGHAICQAMRGNAHGPGWDACPWAFLGYRALLLCSVPDLLGGSYCIAFDNAAWVTA